ncbi:MAG TPA: hypothetical protein PK335_08680 [Draconibacterium sp.]|nr:hypothetical protein [Draconibacterium sp.]
MKKKIITGILSLAILVAGILGFSRLRYLERSIWIFKSNSGQSFRGDRFGREGHDGREFRTRPENYTRGDQPDFRNLPDSVRQKMLTERNLRFENDTLREGKIRSFPDDRSEFREGRPDNDSRRGHDFRRGNHVQLGNVSWFLAVFAGFTVLTIYTDNLIKRKNKNLNK